MSGPGGLLERGTVGAFLAKSADAELRHMIACQCSAGRGGNKGSSCPLAVLRPMRVRWGNDDRLSVWI